MKRRIVFCLGSNLGDRENFLKRACEELALRLNLTQIRKSKILENKAMLLPESPAEWNCDFLNLAISGEVDYSLFPAIKILEIVKKIENDLGRIHRGRWAPREIDIDIVAIDDLKINIENKLTIPHPGLFSRDFFIETVKEIEPDFIKHE